VNKKEVKSALEQWGRVKSQSTPLESLHLFQQIQQRLSSLPASESQKIPGAHSGLPNQRRVINVLLHEAIESLKQIDAETSKLLTERYLDGLSVIELAYRRNVAESYLYKQINQAIEDLAAIILTREVGFLNRKKEVWLQRIDAASYLELVGAEKHKQRLYNLITGEESPWVISVQGIGGIGKTSLTHAVILQVLDDCPFDEVYWVSAKSERFSPIGTIFGDSSAPTQSRSIFFKLLQQVAPDKIDSTRSPFEQILKILQTYLKSQRALVVIDNLETVTDLEELLPHLESLVNPSRIVLTSREHAGFIQPVQRFAIPDLDKPSSLQLIRQEAINTNLVEIGQSEDDELLPIYQTVGGNPLALRLATGLLHTQSLSTLLTSFEDAPTSQVGNLYDFIYQQSWQQLEELERQVLLAMPLTPEAGDALSYLAEIVSLSQAKISSAINQLANLNLIQVHREKPAYRYSIHSLTRTFLLNTAIGWK